MKYRTCSVCDNPFPETNEYFRQRRYKSGNPYFYSQCRVCERQKVSQYHRDNRDNKNAKQRKRYYDNIERERKRCREFMTSWRRKGNNREIERERQRGLYYRDIEESRRKLREYYRRTINKQRAFARKYWHKNRDKIQVRKLGKHGFNSGSVAAANHRAKKLGCEGRHTLKDVQSLYIAQDKHCYWCAEPLNKDNRHVDHIVPLSKGGRNDVSNLCIACQPCNQSKGDKMPDIWIEYLINSIIPNL